MSTTLFKQLLFVLLVLLTGLLRSQTSQYVPGTTCISCPTVPKGASPTPQNGNATIATSYTNTACGLNYTSGSVKLGRRGSINGVIQPAAITIAGIPNCATILKAFLYADASGNGIAVNATVVNPALASAAFPMTMIGQDIDKCWSSLGYIRTHSYRADITSAITGNGSYSVSGLPVSTSTPGNDVDGASIVIIYSDPAQNYTGSIVIADGAMVSVSTVLTRTVTGFSACGASTFANGFMIIGDLQGVGNTNIKINSTTNNVTQNSANDAYWNFIPGASPAVTSGQSSVIFGAANVSGDCFNVVAAGLYFRTNCLTCTSSSNFSVSTTAAGCAANSVTATVTGGNMPYTYTWTGTAQTGSVVTGLTAGPHTVTVADATGCNTTTAVFTVSPTSSPVTVTGNLNICSGTTTTLTASTGYSTYTWTPATGLATTSGSVVTASPVSTTTYVVTGTTGACTNSTSVVVNVTPSPTVSVASNTVICAGTTVTLTASGASTYSWTPATGLNTTSGSQVAASPTVTTSYTVTGSTGSCTDTEVVTVSVASSTVSVSSNTIICSGNSTTLTASGSASYNWSPATGLNTTSGNQVIASPGTTTTYTVTGGVGTCTSTAAVTVSVSITPTITALSNTSMCSGSTTTLTASGATSYSWNPATGLNTATGTTVAASPTTTTSYTVTGATGSCTNSAVVSVSIISSPTITVSSGTFICSGNSTPLVAGGAPTYTWSPSLGLSSINGSTVTASPLVTTSYTVLGGTGTCTNSAVVTVTVITTPTLSISSNTSICSGMTAALSVSGATAYAWSPAAGLSSVTAASVIASPGSTSTYSVTGSISTCTASASVMVTVIPNPVLSVSSNTAVCAGTSVPLSTSGASSFTWSPGSSLSTTTGAQTTASPSATTIYTVTGSNTVGPVTCSSATTVEVTIIPVANPVIDPVPAICAGDYITLNATGGDTYKWMPVTGLANSTASTTIANPPSTTVYTLTVTKAGFCTNTAVIEVVVNPLPIITAGNDTTVNIDEFVTLTGTGNSTVGFLAPAGGTLACNFCPSVPVNPQENTCYTLKGISQFGCVSYDEVCVVVTKDWNVYIPNTFTPNNDGVNDLFMPAGYGLTEISLTIFDRWGHQIFNSNDAMMGWDGKLKGKTCEQGVYIYKAEIKTISGNVVEKTGHVTLLGKD